MTIMRKYILEQCSNLIISMFFGICFSNLYAQTKQDSLSAEYILNLIKDFPDSVVAANGKSTLLLNQKDAIKLGKFHAKRIYGNKVVRKQYPFRIVLIENYWVMIGDRKILEKSNVIGGCLYVIINQKNGAIVYITHTR
jgi:hypothetical protein